MKDFGGSLEKASKWERMRLLLEKVKNLVSGAGRWFPDTSVRHLDGRGNTFGDYSVFNALK